MIVLIALLFSATIIGPSLQEPKRESFEMDQTITFTPLNASEDAILDAHMDDLVNRSRFYRYDLKGVPWEFEAIRCQLIKKHMLFKGKSLNEMHPSEFVAVIPCSAGDIRIIPLWHGSLRTFGDPYRDPHNWAFFSEIVDREMWKLEADDHWLQMAVCYMGMIGETPRLITKNTVKEIAKNDSKNYLHLFPKIERLSKTVRVAFFSLNTDQIMFSEWQFEFDYRGTLKYVGREKLSKSKLLMKLDRK